MKTIIPALLLAVAAVGTTGCGLRSSAFYRDDVQKLLESKTGDITACYNQALAGDKSAQGEMTVRFEVAEDSGLIQNAVVQGESNPALQSCVTTNIEGLALQPPDVNPGDGTFTWQFTVGGGAS